MSGAALCQDAPVGRRRTSARSFGLRRIIFKMLIIALVFQAVYLVLLRYLNPPLTLTQLCALIETKRLERDDIPLSDIPNDVRLAVLSAEDQRFASHNGFDWGEIQTAFRQNAQHRSPLRGASTISQQVAKNVFLWQRRGWIRKGLEAYFTVLLELVMDKRRILELYLNIAETGPGIFGIEAAARHYFGKSAHSLTSREAALIAACLPNPERYRANRPSPHIRAKAAWILEQMQLLRSYPAVQGLLY